MRLAPRSKTREPRGRGGASRALTRAELEQWLERIARNRGEKDLLRIRDEARRLAPALAAEVEQRRLDELIAAILGTADARLATEPARARGRRQPFDADRIDLFETLHSALAGHVAPLRPEPQDPERALAFFEAYFSNFIDQAMRARTPTDAEDFAELLRLLNRRILEARPGKAPGEWKQQARQFNALVPPDEAEERGLRLRDPG